jgi:WD40 repeat protein
MVRSFTVALLLLAAPVANAQPHLVFDHKIGTDWPLGSYLWMSFVAISSDSQTTAGDGGVPLEEDHLGFWTFPDGKFLRNIDGAPAAISPNFRYLVLEKQILDLQSGKPVLSVAHKKDTLGAAAFSADSELVAVNASPHLVKGLQVTIIRTAGGAVLSSFGTRFICAMAFAPDGHSIVTGHWNNLTLWDVQTGERLALLMSPPRKVDPGDPEGYWRDGRYLGAVAVSPDGKLIAAGSDDGELQVWDFAARKLVHTRALSHAEVTAVAFSPDSSLIATGSYHDGTLRLVDAGTGRLLSEIQVSMFGVGAVAFSPDGKYLVTPSNEGVLDHGKYGRGGSIHVFRVEK